VSLNDLPAEVLDDLGYVLRLAALTEDRTKREQRALDRLAARVDAQINRGAQKGTDPATRPPCTYRIAEDRARPEVQDAALSHGDVRRIGSAVVAVLDHPKDCVCRGDNRAAVPAAGWSRLSEEVQG
jgi:hypothetical protein